MEVGHTKKLNPDQRRREVYCGRPSPLGNPFKLEREEDREKLLDQYRKYLSEQIEIGNEKIINAIKALKNDSVLTCWCHPKRCHCEVIIEFWNKLKSK